MSHLLLSSQVLFQRMGSFWALIYLLSRLNNCRKIATGRTPLTWDEWVNGWMAQRNSFLEQSEKHFWLVKWKSFLYSYQFIPCHTQITNSLLSSLVLKGYYWLGCLRTSGFWHPSLIPLGIRCIGQHPYLSLPSTRQGLRKRLISPSIIWRKPNEKTKWFQISLPISVWHSFSF